MRGEQQGGRLDRWCEQGRVAHAPILFGIALGRGLTTKEPLMNQKQEAYLQAMRDFLGEDGKDTKTLARDYNQLSTTEKLFFRCWLRLIADTPLPTQAKD